VTPANRRVGPPQRDSGSVSVPALAGAGGGGPRFGFLAAVRTMLSIALVAGASSALAWGARRYMLTSPRFAVTRVEVTGAERRPADEIVAESGIASGQNVFSVDLDSARAQILRDAWIADVTLARRLPGTVSIRVVEHKAAALVAAGSILLADAAGEPFKELGPGDPVDLPVLTGLTPESIAADREGARTAIRRSVEIAAEYGQGPMAKRAPLQEVHVDPGGGFTLVVGRSSAQLVLGAPPFRRKLEQAARVVAELDKRGAKAQSIMLDNEARPDRVVVRLQ
jgi:cell division protein FtsQ